MKKQTQTIRDRQIRNAAPLMLRTLKRIVAQNRRWHRQQHASRDPIEHMTAEACQVWRAVLYAIAVAEGQK